MAKVGLSCLLKWVELSSQSGESCFGTSSIWDELSWGELSLGKVARKSSGT